MSSRVCWRKRLPHSDPQIGDVYYYPYVWLRQGQHGEPEKDRPCCVAVRMPPGRVYRGADVFMFALSQSGVPHDGYGIEVPPSEIAHLRKLDQTLPTYLVTSEHNSDLSNHPTFHDLEYLGTFSKEFMKTVVLEEIKVRFGMGTGEINRVGADPS